MEGLKLRLIYTSRPAEVREHSPDIEGVPFSKHRIVGIPICAFRPRLSRIDGFTKCSAAMPYFFS